MRFFVKNTISICLLLLFLTPIIAKTGDALFHHHEHSYCSLHCGEHFDEEHSQCPILKYELNALADRILKIEFENLLFYESTVIQVCFHEYSHKKQFLIFLSAPPSL